MAAVESSDLGACKKLRKTAREPTGAAFMLRCAELGLSDEALESMTVGMIYDMLCEKFNDSCEYPDEATAEEIANF